MAGWYLVLVLLNGHVTVNEAPMSAEGCQTQLAMTTQLGAHGACVEIK